MDWVVPTYSRDVVDQAGVTIADPTADPFAWTQAIDVVNNWRASHYFPLNTFQIGLRDRLDKIDAAGVVAQRIKRRSSIEEKLRRYPGISLSEIQDIGGCRAVVKSVADVRSIVERYRESRHKHELVDESNYIDNPKRSGYRSYHLIYRYWSKGNSEYNGLKIEIQLRSRYQHFWATAVETVGAFTNQALKSSAGDAKWLRFFSLMGATIALTEGTAPVPRTPKEVEQLTEELTALSRDLDVENKLQAFGAAFSLSMQAIPAWAKFCLITIDIANKKIGITSYRLNQLREAVEVYSSYEAKGTGLDTVLVSADSLAQLRRAYPNYFADTGEFLVLVRQATKSQ